MEHVNASLGQRVLFLLPDTSSSSPVAHQFTSSPAAAHQFTSSSPVHQFTTSSPAAHQFTSSSPVHQQLTSSPAALQQRREEASSRSMKDNSCPRVLLVVLCAAVFVAVLVINALAGAGKGPFYSSTGNVSTRYETDITPAGWTFSIWGVIYTWLTLMVLYITSYVCRGSWAQSLLPYTFYFCWLSNMVLNMAWLLLWDRELMLAALVVLILIAISSYSALFCCCFATDYYGLWLQTYHRKDLACLRILVQNGLALYSTWISIASLINFALVLHLWGVDRSTAATASLCILFAEVVLWFILENWVLDRWVRNILTIYPVVIVALVGAIFRHFNPADPTPNTVFMVVLLVLACILLVSRVCTVIWRNMWRPLHSPGSARLMISPLDGGKFKMFT